MRLTEVKRVTAKEILNVENLSVTFPASSGKIKAVRGISFDLKEGETLGIVGESGSGKSVTAFSVIGLLPEGADVKGRCVFNGSDLFSLSEKEFEALRGSEIGMIFQDPLSSLDPCFTIADHLVGTLKAHGMKDKKAAWTQAEEMLRSVGIKNSEQVMKQYPFELSGGMRQRIMIAMALLCKPKLLLADEPTTALDVTVQDQILRLLKKLKSENRTSMLFITHNFGIVARLCDRVIVMYGGRVMERASVKEIFENPVHPYTRALLAAIPRMDDDKNVPLPAISGHPHDPHSDFDGCPFMERCEYADEMCRRRPDEIFVREGHFAACYHIMRGEN